MTSLRTSCDAAITDGPGIVAIEDMNGVPRPITSLVRQGDNFRTAAIAWSGGLRYPHLEMVDLTAPNILDALYTART